MILHEFLAIVLDSRSARRPARVHASPAANGESAHHRIGHDA